jgi:hypothetical protein
MDSTDSRGFSLLPLVILVALWLLCAGLISWLTGWPAWASALLGFVAALLFIHLVGAAEDLFRGN